MVTSSYIYWYQFALFWFSTTSILWFHQGTCKYFTRDGKVITNTGYCSLHYCYLWWWYGMSASSPSTVYCGLYTRGTKWRMSHLPNYSSSLIIQLKWQSAGTADNNNSNIGVCNLVLLPTSCILWQRRVPSYKQGSWGLPVMIVKCYFPSNFWWIIKWRTCSKIS